MKKNSLYTAALAVCLCLFSNASKECAKIIREKSLDSVEEKKVSNEQKSIDKGDGTVEFLFVNVLFFQTT